MGALHFYYATYRGFLHQLHDAAEENHSDTRDSRFYFRRCDSSAPSSLHPFLLLTIASLQA